MVFIESLDIGLIGIIEPLIVSLVADNLVLVVKCFYLFNRYYLRKELIMVAKIKEIIEKLKALLHI